MKKQSFYAALALSGLFYVNGAAAQVSTAEKATAESLFENGLELMRVGSFKEACPKLEMSQRIESTVGTLLYLGECYEKLGRTASAWVTFKEAASLARSAAQAPRAAVAQKRADRLATELSKVTLEISTEAREVPGLQVRVGSVSVPTEAAAAGLSVPVDPGELLVEVSAPGYATSTLKLTVEPKGRGVVKIPVLVAQASPTAPTPIQPTVTGTGVAQGQPEAAQTGSVVTNSATPKRKVPVLPVALGVVGVVALGAGTYFGVTAMGDASDSRELCPAGVCREQRGESLMNDARTAARLSNVAFGIGVAAVAAGAIVYLASPSPSGSEVSLSPWVGSEHAGLSLQGRL